MGGAPPDMPLWHERLATMFAEGVVLGCVGGRSYGWLNKRKMQRLTTPQPFGNLQQLSPPTTPNQPAALQKQTKLECGISIIVRKEMVIV